MPVFLLKLTNATTRNGDKFSVASGKSRKQNDTQSNSNTNIISNKSTHVRNKANVFYIYKKMYIYF